jgi:Pyruvate/2-oxoacid:ferredoxin oxidoreductase delta subunit
MDAQIIRRKHRDPADRFWAKVIHGPGGCWLWTGSIVKEGYGQFFLYWDEEHRRSQPIRAHRWAYQYLIGPIPEGLTIDHVQARGCTSRACVNPLHMEPVSTAVNSMRGNSPIAQHARQTHCKNGHEFTPENTFHPKPDGTHRTHRKCRICRRLYQQERNSRIRSSVPVR